MNEDGYIVEFHQIGNSVKVTAMDPATLTEVSIIGSDRANKQQLSELAIRKLFYVMGKQE